LQRPLTKRSRDFASAKPNFANSAGNCRNWLHFIERNCIDLEAFK
jgi:hypothetical protein